MTYDAEHRHRAKGAWCKEMNTKAYLLPVKIALQFQAEFSPHEAQGTLGNDGNW